LVIFERLQKPFLTVETGEAYQPIRLAYNLHKKNQLIDLLENSQCCQKHADNDMAWDWFWQGECEDIHFESTDVYKKSTQPLRLGTLLIHDDVLHINLPSFKRACLAVPFFHGLIKTDFATIRHGDFINKVFGADEHLPHGFSELFKEEELEKLIRERTADYHQIEIECENAATAEEAVNILTAYSKKEAEKPLPFTERYVFQHEENADPDVIFLGFYIFLRGRELVAIRRWSGEDNYSLGQAAEETIEKVFGGVGIDLIE
jgi:hypothetical protein